MALSRSACNHNPQVSFKGMRRQGLTPDGLHVLYACERCPATHLAERCTATLVDANETRCKNAALMGRDQCLAHWALTPEGAKAVSG